MTTTERAAGIVAEVVSAVGQNRAPHLSTKELEFLAWYHHRAYRLSVIAETARSLIPRQSVSGQMVWRGLDGYEEGDAP